MTNLIDSAEEAKLLLYQTDNKNKFSRMIDIFEHYLTDFRFRERVSKGFGNKTIYTIWAYIEKSKEDIIRKEVSRLDKPGGMYASFLFEKVR